MYTDIEEGQDTGGSRTPTEGAGAGEHAVEAGDCLHSIAYQYGFFWETLWNHPDNAELKRERRDPGVLLPGDRITVPPLTARLEPCQTEAKHVFRRRGVPARLRIRILADEPAADEELDAVPESAGSSQEGGESGGASGAAAEAGGGGPGEPAGPAPRERRPCADQPFVMDIDGTWVRGSTDADGWIDRPIPPGARRAVITLRPAGAPERVFAVDLGLLDPIGTARGVQQRLRNLGFECPGSEEYDAGTERAVRQFQGAEGLGTSGSADEQTTQRLCERHGS